MPIQSSSWEIAEESECYRVGDLVVEVEARRVLRDGEEIHLTELSFDLLVVLLRHAPAIVSKKDLMSEAWRGQLVELDTVKKRVTLLREALTANGSQSSLIRVARGRGYGFNATVERFGKVEQPTSRGKRYIWNVIISSVLVAGGLVIAVMLTLRFAGDEQQVLPARTSNPGMINKENLVAKSQLAPNIAEIDPAAFQAYLDGKRLRRAGDLVAATSALEYAIDIEPRFAAAYAELAICKIGHPVYFSGSHVKPSRQIAHEMVRRALELDPTLPEAYAAGAAVAIFLDWDWARAEVLLKQGLSISPDDEYLFTYMSLLAEVHGDSARAVSLAKPLLARKSTSAKGYYGLGNKLYGARRFREAIDAYRAALTLDPEVSFAHLAIGRARALQGNPEAAFKEIEQEKHPQFKLYASVIAHSVAGNETEANLSLDQLIEQGTPQFAYWIGSLYAFRGDNDQAFMYLDTAFELRELGLIKIQTDPLIDQLRSDPRYDHLLARLNLN